MFKFLRVLITDPIFLKFFGFFIKQNNNTLFCVPDEALLIDKVDIINYSSDNALTFVNYLVRDKDIKNLKIFILCFDKEREKEYVQYCSKFKNVELKLIYKNYSTNDRILLKIKTIFNFYYNFYKSRFIISSNVLLRFPFRFKSQVYISLNYFTPFKFDPQIKKNGKGVDIVMSTSMLSSQIVSITSRVNYNNFKTLGFPRHDNILNPRYSKSEILEKLSLKFFAEKVILYIPTHRDYEKDKSTKRDIFGYTSASTELMNIIEKYNAVILVKIHPTQNLLCFEPINNERVITLKPSYEFSLYDLIPHADILITDYSSVYFDFLLMDKPIVFNFYDIEIYKKTRGFSYDPIEAVCAGLISKTIIDFLQNIEKCLLYGDDQNFYKRQFVNDLMNTHKDAFGSKRILDFLKPIFEINKHTINN